jgi:hypothetical protein
MKKVFDGKKKSVKVVESRNGGKSKQNFKNKEQNQEKTKEELLAEFQKKTNVFANKILKYMRAFKYIAGLITINDEYSSKILYNEMSSMGDKNNLEYLDLKLYEVLLTLSVENRDKVISGKCDESLLLNKIWSKNYILTEQYLAESIRA